MAIGITVKFGNQYKRLWFSVENSDEATKKLDAIRKEINAIDDKIAWSDFLKLVETKFETQGFERIKR